MTTKLRFEVQGKSPLVYLTFYNDDFEKNLAEVNADDFDHIEFQLANEVKSFIPGQGLEAGEISDVKVFKNEELIYDGGIVDLDDLVADEEYKNEMLNMGMMIVNTYQSGADIDNILSVNKILKDHVFGQLLMILLKNITTAPSKKLSAIKQKVRLPLI